MSKGRRRAFGALCVIVAAGAAAVVASGAPPSATAVKALVNPPTTIACDGYVDAQVQVTGHAGTSGQATDVMLVLDLSGSMSSPSTDFTQEKQAAKDALAALDAADGATDSSIANNRVGLVTYSGSTGVLRKAVGTSYGELYSYIDTGLPAPNGGSPHNAGISTASTNLPAGGNARAMVLVTDGQATGNDLTNATTAATNAKASGVRIVPIGIASDVSQTNLQTWASNAAYYQNGTTAAIDKTKLITDLGASVVIPAGFTLTETLGTKFTATSNSATAGTVTGGGTGTLTWTGTGTFTSLTDQTVTLNYRATRNVGDLNLFSVTNELVSTTGPLTVTGGGGGGSGTVTSPDKAYIDVLPCGTSLLDKDDVHRRVVHVGGSNGGVQYTLLNARHAHHAGRRSSPLGCQAAPPAGACPGFDTQHERRSVRHPAAHDSRPVRGRDPEDGARQQEMVADRRVCRHEHEVHHRDRFTREPASRSDALRRPLLGAAAQLAATRVHPGSRLGVGTLDHQPVAGRRTATR